MTRLCWTLAALTMMGAYLCFALAFSLFTLVAYPLAEIGDAATRQLKRLALRRSLKP
jgi:hypothetical protein